MYFVEDIPFDHALGDLKQRLCEMNNRCLES